jgi:HPt (histidine-containing phosphotransfer) domain-containing protein
MSPETPDRAAVQSRLRELAVRFVQRSLGEVATLRDLMTRVRENDRDALTELEKLSHKIHGTAATVGYRSVSGRAGEIERLAEAALASESGLDQEGCARIQELLTLLEADLRAVQGSQP